VLPRYATKRHNARHLVHLSKLSTQANGYKEKDYNFIRQGRVNKQAQPKIPLTLRRLMSYIYMEHPFLMFLDHTQRRNTVGRTPLDE